MSLQQAAQPPPTPAPLPGVLQEGVLHAGGARSHPAPAGSRASRLGAAAPPPTKQEPIRPLGSRRGVPSEAAAAEGASVPGGARPTGPATVSPAAASGVTPKPGWGPVRQVPRKLTVCRGSRAGPQRAATTPRGSAARRHAVCPPVLSTHRTGQSWHPLRGLPPPRRWPCASPPARPRGPPLMNSSCSDAAPWGPDPLGHPGAPPALGCPCTAATPGSHCASVFTGRWCRSVRCGLRAAA